MSIPIWGGGAKDIISPAPHMEYALPSPQLYVMTLPFGLGSTVNVSSVMESTYQPFDTQG
jgi:hypothetical protein